MSLQEHMERNVKTKTPHIRKNIQCKQQDSGFRKLDGNLKKFTQPNKAENEQQGEYADGIIKELLYHRHNNAPCIPPKTVKGPSLKPKAVCFNFSGSDLTHLEVKREMDKLLVAYPGIKMSTIEFQPRIKLLLHDKMDNTCRWVISFHTEWDRYRMTNRELTLRDPSTMGVNYSTTKTKSDKLNRRKSSTHSLRKALDCWSIGMNSNKACEDSTHARLIASSIFSGTILNEFDDWCDYKEMALN